MLTVSVCLLLLPLHAEHSMEHMCVSNDNCDAYGVLGESEKAVSDVELRMNEDEFTVNRRPLRF